MEFVTSDSRTATVKVVGEFDVILVVSVEDELNECLDKGCTEIVFDFEKTTYIDSTVISRIVSFERKLRKVNGKVYLINMTGEVLRVLNATNLLARMKRA